MPGRFGQVFPQLHLAPARRPQGGFPFGHVCMFSVLVRQPMAHLSFHVHFVRAVDVWVLVQGHREGPGSGVAEAQPGLRSGVTATRGVQG